MNNKTLFLLLIIILGAAALFGQPPQKATSEVVQIRVYEPRVDPFKDEGIYLQLLIQPDNAVEIFGYKEIALSSFNDDTGKDLLAEGRKWEEAHPGYYASWVINGAEIDNNHPLRPTHLVALVRSKALPSKEAKSLSGRGTVTAILNKGPEKTAKLSFDPKNVPQDRMNWEAPLEGDGYACLLKGSGNSSSTVPGTGASQVSSYFCSLESESPIRMLRILDANEKLLEIYENPRRIQVSAQDGPLTFEVTYFQPEFRELPFQFSTSIGL